MSKTPFNLDCDDTSDEPRPWRWRNLRSFHVGIAFAPLPWDWQLGFVGYDDGGMGGCTGMTWTAIVGPISLQLSVGIGHISTPGWRGRIGLSEIEAWERSGGR